MYVCQVFWTCKWLFLISLVTKSIFSKRDMAGDLKYDNIGHQVDHFFVWSKPGGIEIEQSKDYN